MATINSTLLIEVALDLANSIGNEDRFDRLLTSIRKAINCDAIALLSFHKSVLTPLSIQGLSPDTLGRRFNIDDHPRLADICKSAKPIRFASDSPHPDPYDGLLLAQPGDIPVHACMGFPLYSDGTLIGVVTLDSLMPDVFDAIPPRTLEIIAAMSAATLKTAFQLNKLESRARHTQDLLQELTHEALTRDGGELIGQSTAMTTLKNDINLIASSDYSVLITGETGVGKELVARKVHQLSYRSDRPLIHLNCAALPETLAESELFGHVKGAFTGADKDRAGKFQLADGGTIFLDEVGELPLSVQSKLLRVLQSGEIQPVGRDQVSRVDVRVIAATNRDLKQEVDSGKFRADLYHRLSVYPIAVSALRERKKDVLLIAGYFLESTARKLGVRQLKLSKSSESILLNYTWPGNVRELEHVISRASLKAKSQMTSGDIVSLEPQHFDLFITDVSEKSPAAVAPRDETIGPLQNSLNKFQRDYILQALTVSEGNWTQAAKILQVDRANLARLAKRLGIEVKKKISAN